MSLIRTNEQSNLMENWNFSKQKFLDISNLGYPYYHIHPYKQHHVKHLVENLPIFVEYAIVFGSSVQTWHFYEKDLDVCLIYDTKQDSLFVDRNKIRYKSVDLNIMTYDKIEDLFCNTDDVNNIRTQIVMGGVMVYDKKNRPFEKSRGGLGTDSTQPGQQ